MSSSKKKKGRRSSLAPTKLKLDYLPIPGADLYRSVDGSLSNEDRLERLAHICLEHTVCGVVQDVEAPEVKEGLQEVSDGFRRMLAQSEPQAVIKQTCSGESVDEMLECDELETTIQEDIDRLYEEEKAWYKAIDDVNRVTQTAERDYSRTELLEKNMTEEQKQLSDTYLPNLENLASLSKVVQNACNKAFILKQENGRNWHCLEELKLETEHCLQKSVSLLHSKSISLQQSPQDMIQNFINLPVLVDEQ